MPERTFFTLRYALPGYTFILMSLLVAYPRLEDVVFQVEVAAFLAFFSLLSGGALGFLVSQVWYRFYLKFLRFRYVISTATIKLLKDQYDITEDPDHQIVFIDYVHHLSGKETRIYTERRYDLMHICGSTLATMFAGSFFGFLIRIGCLNTKTTLAEAIKSFQNISLSRLELLQIHTFDLMAICIFVFLMFFLLRSFQHATKELRMALEISVREVVNSGKFPRWKARKVFRADYFSEVKRRKEKQ